MTKNASKNTAPFSAPLSFGDVSKWFEQFKVPGVDMSAIVGAQRKDVEALVEANKATYEAMQEIVRKQAEMLTQTMQGIQDAAKSAAGGKGTDPLKQAELARGACQKALSDMQEIAEIARKAQVEATARITQRASASMQEIQKMMQPK